MEDDLKVAVIGAGVMGTGVAHDLARHGISTVVIDVSEAQLARCERAIRSNLRLYRFHPAHGKLGEPIDVILGRLALTTDLTRARGAAFVIENVTEDASIKRALYEKLDAIVDPAAVIGVNTSAIPITRIAGLLRAPERVLGSHFMNPVPLKPTVEVVRAAHTTDETLARFSALLARLGKQAVVVKDSPGFVTNRAMMLFVNEAMFTVQEGVAEPEAIDRLFRECFGHTMGPLQTADLIGLDTVLRSLEVLWMDFKDPKYRPCPRLVHMVDAGHLGVKSGRGFYEYPTADDDEAAR